MKCAAATTATGMWASRVAHAVRLFACIAGLDGDGIATPWSPPSVPAPPVKPVWSVVDSGAGVARDDGAEVTQTTNGTATQRRDRWRR
jgi:hypothetical protein